MTGDNAGPLSAEDRNIQLTSGRGRAVVDIATASVLTRDLLVSGRAVALATEDAPAVHFTSDEERAASLAAFMAHRPFGDVWVFAYGSLIWNPSLKVAERKIVRIEGWHRKFCLSMMAGRATVALPGLALGLDQGGACTGVAYRIAENDLQSELPLLWRREMLFGGYIPRWVEIRDIDGRSAGSAITFTIDTQHRHYAGGLSRGDIVRRLATAAGSWGTAANYLFRTINALRYYDIRDVDLEYIGAHVAAASLSTSSS